MKETAAHEFGHTLGLNHEDKLEGEYMTLKNPRIYLPIIVGLLILITIGIVINNSN